MNISTHWLNWQTLPRYCREYSWVHFSQSLYNGAFESIRLGKVDSGCCIYGHVDVCNLCCSMTQWKIADWALITSHCECVTFAEGLVERPYTPCDLVYIELLSQQFNIVWSTLNFCKYSAHIVVADHDTFRVSRCARLNVVWITIINNNIIIYIFL